MVVGRVARVKEVKKVCPLPEWVWDADELEMP